jgi:hypothetical protein
MIVTTMRESDAGRALHRDHEDRCPDHCCKVPLQSHRRLSHSMN